MIQRRLPVGIGKETYRRDFSQVRKQRCTGSVKTALNSSDVTACNRGGLLVRDFQDTDQQQDFAMMRFKAVYGFMHLSHFDAAFLRGRHPAHV